MKNKLNILVRIFMRFPQQTRNHCNICFYFNCFSCAILGNCLRFVYIIVDLLKVLKEFKNKMQKLL